MRIQDSKRFLLIVAALAFISLLTARSVSAQATHQLIVNPIQVCDDSGIVCANPNRELFLAETDKIWIQAGLDIKFLDWKVMNSTAHLSGSDLGPISSASGNQEMFGDVINMWFVQSIDGGPFGKASINGRSSMIANSIFSYSGGAGRRDTIAHELGHNLNLPHISGTFPLNLMESGGTRNPATALDQIFPSGAMKDQLTASQISTAIGSRFVNPLNFSIPGDANIDGFVNQIDVDFFVAGWLHEQPDPDVNSWMKGDFDLDGKTTLIDASILHQALQANGQGAFNFGLLGPAVPEPGTVALLMIGCLGMLFSRSRRAGRRAGS